MKNMFTRLISGIIFIAIIISSILVSPYSFVAVFSVITALALREFHKLTNNNSDINVNIPAAMVGGVLLFVCSYLHSINFTSLPVYNVYGFYIAILLIAELFRKKQNPVQNWAYLILGQVMIALPFAILNHILYINHYQPIILLAVFISIWVNDTGAYCTGMLLGKHKLFERISPKKTWEGFVGGAAFALLSGYFFSIYIKELTLLQWFIYSEIIVIFGTLGDLSESLLKRTIGVKDSGNLIPGHGGILDRFDSLMLAAPIVYIFLSIILNK